MTSLIDTLQSFFQWIYASVDSLIEFSESAISWVSGMWLTVQTVANVVCPPALQGILALMISFMLVFLVVRLVVNLL